jgi:hypothetical protein
MSEYWNNGTTEEKTAMMAGIMECWNNGRMG